MRTRSPVKRPRGKAFTRPARPVGEDCDTWRILSVHASRLERDLAGRLFIVELEGCGRCDGSYNDVDRREIGYREALEWIARHTWWKNPWKVLAHHGIKRPSAAQPSHRP